jgi:hypothetical protein
VQLLRERAEVSEHQAEELQMNLHTTTLRLQEMEERYQVLLPVLSSLVKSG